MNSLAPGTSTISQDTNLPPKTSQKYRKQYTFWEESFRPLQSCPEVLYTLFKWFVKLCHVTEKHYNCWFSYKGPIQKNCDEWIQSRAHRNCSSTWDAPCLYSFSTNAMQMYNSLLEECNVMDSMCAYVCVLYIYIYICCYYFMLTDQKK